MPDQFAASSVFTYADALPREAGVSRRDPSPVIAWGGRYHVWYSRSTISHDGYAASVWHATSADGRRWHEQGEALPKGPSGAFDEHGVFTPTILLADDRLHLFYTAVPAPFDRHTRTAVGIASAASPDGPWVRFAGNPVLRPSDCPEDFDSMRVDDTCLIARRGEFWLYYKGRQLARTPGQTQMGLAIASSPTGPYTKHPGNPVLDSGHEICVWPQGTGVGCLVCNVGPQGNSLQYSDDGIHFRKLADVVPHKAPGPFRADAFKDGIGPGVTWGLAMAADAGWPYLVRFDCDLTLLGDDVPRRSPEA